MLGVLGYVSILTQQNEHAQQDGQRRPQAEAWWRQEGLDLAHLAQTAALLTHTHAEGQRGSAAEWRLTTIRHHQHQAEGPLTGAPWLARYDAGSVVWEQEGGDSMSGKTRR